MKKYLPLFLLLAALLPGTSLAEVNDEAGVLRVIEKLGNWIYSIFLIVAVIMIVVTAFKFLTAGGDTTKYSEAKTSLFWTVVAVALAAGSRGIVAITASLVS